MSDETSFLTRWSQRKAEQKSQPQSAAEIIDEPGEEIAISAEPEQDEPVLTDEDMPTVESLNENSDFSQFFSAGVSEQLRDRALRKLFNLPEFGIRDGLNDYDEDFSKMPALAEAVVAQLRSWVNEKEDDIKEEISAQISGHNSSEQTEEAEGLETLKTDNPAQLIEQDDELGDADLEG